MCCVLSCSVMPKSLRLHGLSATSVHVDSAGRNAGVGCHALLQGILPTQESNSYLREMSWSPWFPSQQTLGAPASHTSRFFFSLFKVSSLEKLKKYI